MKKFSFPNLGWDKVLKIFISLLIPLAGGGKYEEPYAFISLMLIPLIIIIMRDRSLIFPKDILPLILLISYIFISILWSRSPYLTLQWGLFTLLILIVLPFSTNKIVEYSIIFTSIGLFIHFLLGGATYRITQGRASFPFFHPNSAVGFLLPASVMSFKEGVNLYLFIPALIGVFTTSSRAGFIIFFIFSVYMLFRKVPYRRWIITLTLVVFSISLLFMRERLILKTLKTSIKTRIAVWQDSFSALKEEPIIGYGTGTFEKVFPAFQKRGVFSRFPHSSLINWLFSGGIIGFTLFALSIAYPAFKRTRIPLECIPLLLHSIIDFSLSAPANVIIFYLLLLSGNSEGYRVNRGYFKTFSAFVLLLSISFFCSRTFTFTAQILKDKDIRKAGRMAGLSFYFNPLFADGCIMASNFYLESFRRYKSKNDLRIAYKFAKRAVSIESKVYSTHYLLATVYLYYNKYTSALVEFEKALSLYPQYPRLRVFYARALIKWGSLQKAEAVIEKGCRDGYVLLKASNPEAVDIMELYYLNLRLYMARGDEIGARLILNEAENFANALLNKFPKRRTIFRRNTSEVLKDMKFLIEKTFKR